MQEPSPRTSRLAIAGGLAAAIALAGAGFVAGRKSAPAPEVPAAVSPLPPPPAPDPAAPVVPAVLERADLLAIAAQAADAFASDIPSPPAVDAAAGRRFDLIIPFGCAVRGAMESSGAMRWSFDPKAASLRIAADPATWQGEAWTSPEDADGGAVLRGFWITRPWSSATNCAAVRKADTAAADTPLMPPAPTVAIARMIAMEAAGKIRPYEVVRRADPADFDPQEGFRLRITGRVRAASEGGPVKCAQPGGRAQRPVCVITAIFSEVRIENPKNGDVLANWTIEDDVRGAEDRVAANAAAGRR